MKNIRNAAIVGSVALLSAASPAFAQATGTGDATDVATIVADGKAMLTAIVPLVLAIVGFGLFKKLAHRAG